MQIVPNTSNPFTRLDVDLANEVIQKLDGKESFIKTDIVPPVFYAKGYTSAKDYSRQLDRVLPFQDCWDVFVEIGLIEKEGQRWKLVTSAPEQYLTWALTQRESI